MLFFYSDKTRAGVGLISVTVPVDTAPVATSESSSIVGSHASCTIKTSSTTSCSLSPLSGVKKLKATSVVITAVIIVSSVVFMYIYVWNNKTNLQIDIKSLDAVWDFFLISERCVYFRCSTHLTFCCICTDRLQILSSSVVVSLPLVLSSLRWSMLCPVFYLATLLHTVRIILSLCIYSTISSLTQKSKSFSLYKSWSSRDWIRSDWLVFNPYRGTWVFFVHVLYSSSEHIRNETDQEHCKYSNNDFFDLDVFQYTILDLLFHWSFFQ